MKTLALLALALTLTGCATMDRSGVCLGGGIPTDPLGAAVLVVSAAGCMAVTAWRDRAVPAPPLPAPLAEHPPVTPAD